MAAVIFWCCEKENQIEIIRKISEKILDAIIVMKQLTTIVPPFWINVPNHFDQRITDQL